MQAKNRILSVTCLIVGATVAIIATRQVAWEHRRRSLTPSLIACVLQDELDQLQSANELRNSSPMGGGPLPRDSPDQVFLAMGRDPINDAWISPSESLLRGIGMNSVSSVSELKGNNPVYFVSNIRWTDWQSVALDIEQIQGSFHGAMHGMRLRYEAGEWTITDEGAYWSDELQPGDPFAHSNSGLPL